MNNIETGPPDKPEGRSVAGGHVSAAGLIEKFGGIRPMAAKLGIAVSTVQGWRQRNAIPGQRLAAIRAAAAQHGIALGETLIEGSQAKSVASTKGSMGLATANASRPDRQQSPKSRSLFLPIGMATVALLLAVTVLGLFLWLSAVGGDEDRRMADLVARLAALESGPEPGTNQQLVQRIAELEQQLRLVATDRGGSPDPQLLQRIAELERQLTQVSVEPGDDPRVEQLAAEAQIAHERVGVLEDKLARLATDSPLAGADAVVVALQGDIEALRGRLTELSSLAAQTDGRMAQTVALTLAIGQLRTAIAEGRPYSNELATIVAFGIDDPVVVEALGSLAPYAAVRVADHAGLHADFAAVARRAIQAERSADDEDWVDRLFTRAGALVSIRQIGPDVFGGSAEAVIARAEARLAASDLVGAASELDSLTGHAAGEFADWLAGAHSSLAATTALAVLDQQVRAALATSDARP